MKILVTGSSGFVGSHLVSYLKEKGHELLCPTRQDLGGSIGSKTDWSPWLKHSPDAVIHLANQAHIMRATPEADSRFFEINVEGTQNLAKQAIAEGVRRFVFLSSIKVNGEGRNTPYNEADPPQPTDAYGQSKLQAENILLGLAARDPKFEPVILRPPLVYGPGVKANFKNLLRAISQRIPLPLGAVENQRSFIYVLNLASAIERCLQHPQVPGRVFMVRDREDLSTSELIESLAQAMGQKSRLIPVPVPLLRLGGRILGKGAAVSRLVDSLQVDDAQFRTVTSWLPPFNQKEAFRATVGFI